MSKHTPGPWIRRWLGDSEWAAGPAYHPTLIRVSRSDHGMGYEEIAATARLVAAAPDLLEALQDAVSTMPADSPVKWVVWARAAIAKAEGR
jgi:hypothetical protein